MPTVSIALTTHNGGEYLREQLDSLLSQSFTDFEVIAVDDSSSDKTKSILIEYSEKISRFQVFFNDTPLGIQKNFELAFSRCRGKWIAPCDQDDIWHRDKLKLILDALNESPGYLLAYCNSEFVDSGGHSLGLSMFDRFSPVDGSNILQFAFSNCVSGHSMLFDRQLLPLAVPFPAVPMYDWWLAMVASTHGRLLIIDKPLVQFRQHETSATNKTPSAQKERRRQTTKLQRHSRRKSDSLRRLEAFSRLPGAAGLAYRELLNLSNKHTLMGINVGLAKYIFIHRRDLFAISGNNTVRMLGRMWRALFNMR